MLACYSIIYQTGSAAMPQVIPVSTAAQPLSETPSIPSGSSGGVKPGTALVSSNLIRTNEKYKYSQLSPIATTSRKRQPPVSDHFAK